MLAASTVAAADIQTFNGPDTVWRLLESSVASRVLAHERLPGGARNDDGCERIVVAAPAGQSVLFQCATAHVAVLDELAVRMWVKASRPDVQLAARVVMPRSTDAQGRSPAKTVVRGAVYNRPRHWQQLVLADVPELLAAQVRVMRSVAGAGIDPREAFIDAIVIVVPGEPQGVEIVTDELDVDGIVVRKAEGVQLTGFPAPAAPALGRLLAANLDSDLANASPVRLHGATLLIDGRPFLPRAIQWQGEPLQLLAERGFNAVQLPQPPTPEQVADAERGALWFICAAPRPDALTGSGIGQPGDRVLAWYLEDEAADIDPDYARRWAELVRERDVVSDRPVVMAPETDWAATSKMAEILLARHPRSGRMSGEEFDEWLATRPQLAKPGTPFWTCLATQFGDAVRRQSASLSGQAVPSIAVGAEQLETLVWLAGTRGSRGFVFQSNSSLTEPDPTTRQRAAMLELINRRLQLIEPWLASGKVVSRVASSDAAWTGVVLHVDRARLLIPIAASITSRSGTASTPTAPLSGADVAFVVSGVPESCQVFLFSPVSLRPLATQRVAGGTRVLLPPGDAMALLTEDPQVIQGLRQRIARDGSRIARLRRDLAERRIAAIIDTGRQLTQLGYRDDAAARGIASASAQLRQCDSLLATGRAEQAYQLVNTLDKLLDQAAIEQQRVVGVPTTIGSYPLALSDGQLAEHAKFLRSFDALRGGENLLYGGDFEDLGQLTRFGWQHVGHPLPGVDSRAELSASQPQHGSYCLELSAGAAPETEQASVVSSAPVWITSPPMPVERGPIVEITGWVRVDRPITGSPDGLQIVDSLGGPELSLTVRQTSGWQPFQMIRAVPESTELRLTFALMGIGSAQIDGVMVRVLQQPLARRLPPVPPATADERGRDSFSTQDPGGL